MEIIPYISGITSAVSAIGSIGAIIVAIYIHHSAQKPNVIVYLEYGDDEASMYLYVKNIGGGLARNVKLSGFDYSLAKDEFIHILRRGFLEKGIPILVPGACRKTLINSGSFLASNENKSSEITISYDSRGLIFSKHIQESFVLDYYSFAGNIQIKSEVFKIRTAIEELVSEIKKDGHKKR